MGPAATFVNCVYTTKITQQFRLLGVPLTVISVLATGEPAHNNGCDALSWKGWTPMTPTFTHSKASVEISDGHADCQTRRTVLGL